MDSLTQIVLGGAVGAVVGGKKYGRKAALIGAICGTIPDLDFLWLNHQDPVTKFTYHRGFTHSFLFAFLAAPVFAFLFSRLKWFKSAFKDKIFHLLIFFSFVTHPILDSFTIYGTQLFWPFNVPPVGIGSIFIIDGGYTFPLIISLIWFLFNKSKRALCVGLAMSSLYLVWGVGIQQYVYQQFHKNYMKPYNHVLVQATPFNTLLWRILVMKDNGYEVGYYSIFDKEHDVEYTSYNSKPSLIEPIKDSFAVNRLEWFTKGFNKVRLRDEQIIMIDLRMGIEADDYVFGFIVGEKNKHGIIAIPNERYRTTRDMRKVSVIWDRIWDEETKI